jgi:hypothetical protein
MTDSGIVLEHARMSVGEDFADDLTDRIVIGAVKGFVWLWCLPALLVAFVVTWTAIGIWRGVLMVERLVRWLAGWSRPRVQAVDHRMPLLGWNPLLTAHVRHDLARPNLSRIDAPQVIEG